MYSGNGGISLNQPDSLTSYDLNAQRQWRCMKFEELTSDLVEKIAIPVRNVMEDAAWLDNKDSKQYIRI